MTIRILTFLNLLDNQKNISITNLALIALVIKMLISPNLDWPSVVTLITVFANYMQKRQVSNKIDQHESTLEMKKVQEQYNAAVLAQATTIKDIKDQLGRVSSALDFSKMVKR